MLATEQVAAWIDEAERVVFFTGAGISTGSGLPDYRGPDGVWTRRDRGLPPPRMSVPMAEVKPNRAHAALVELERRGKLWFLISQNVDNLHRASGFPPEKLAELHGNSRLARCVECDDRAVDPAQGACPSCGGQLVSSVVHFGDPMPARDLARSAAHARRCDLFVVVGSSLVVTPAADMPREALDAGARLVIINRGATPFDDEADLLIDGDIGEVVPAIVERVSAAS